MHFNRGDIVENVRRRSDVMFVIAPIGYNGMVCRQADGSIGYHLTARLSLCDRRLTKLQQRHLAHMKEEDSW